MCTVCIGHLHSPPFSGSLELLVISLPAACPLFMVINNILSLISTALCTWVMHNLPGGCVLKKTKTIPSAVSC